MDETSEGFECFFHTDMTPYAGEYVAICGKKVIAYSKSFKEVVSEAQKVCGDKRPFYAAVPESGTWL